MIDDNDDEEAVVSFELFFSGTELDFFTDCAKGCGTRFSCNEFDTSPMHLLASKTLDKYSKDSFFLS